MIHKAITIWFVIYTAFSSNVYGVLFNETRYVHERLISFYSNNNKSLTSLIPLADLSNPITVELTLCLYSVDGFNAVNGQVDISASLYMEWTDETYSSSVGNFDFSNYDTGYSVTISPDEIWTPSLVLLNAVDGVRNVGDQAYTVRYLVNDGRAKWQPRAVIQAACTPNVKYYPFDRQDCSFVYTAWGYTTAEVVLESAQSDWNLCDYTPNAVWSLIETSAEKYTKNGQSYVKFMFTIEREPMYFVINVICPIVILAFLDGFVFLLSAESGERVGFSVTCFLSFVFMLQTVMNFLPQTAEPMSILCFYIVVMMVASIVQSIVTVLILRIYHKPEDAKVPHSVQRVVRVVTFAWLGSVWRRLRKICRKSATVHVDEPSSEGNNRRSTVGMSHVVSVNSIELMAMNRRPPSSSEVPSDPTRNFSTEPVSPSSPDSKIPSSLDKAGSSLSSGDSPSLLLFKNSRDSAEIKRQSASTGSNDCNDKDKDIPEKSNETKWPEVARTLDMFFFCAFTGFQLAFTLMYILPLSKGGS